MRSIKNALLKKSERKNRYDITPIFWPLILITIAIGIYYYFKSHEYFPLWISKLYIALKIFIAFEVIIGSAKTIIMPLVTLMIALLLIFVAQVHHLDLLSNNEIWQIIYLSIIGFVVSILVKW